MDAIPSARVSPYADDNGEWITVVIPDMTITSVYRRNNRTIEQLQPGHEKPNEHWAALPRPNWLMGGDMNSTPTDEILQVWSAHHGATILHPGTADAPESTRWESNYCIDWNVQKKKVFRCSLTAD